MSNGAKFGLLIDLGIITIPPGNSLDKFFWKKPKPMKSKGFSHFDRNCTDKNFSNPTRVLKPGDKLWVRVFEQIVSGTTTSEERLAFLKRRKALLVGAYGLPPVFKQKRNLLPKGKLYFSFDNKSRLCRWSIDPRVHQVPCFSAEDLGGFAFFLLGFEINLWNANHCLLCFCLPAEASA